LELWLCDAAHVKNFKMYDYNLVLGRNIADHRITLSLPACSYLRQSEVNANQILARVDEGMSRWLQGPVLAVGAYREDDTDETASIDLGPLDFRHALDNLRTRYSHTARY
jgi:hypothetical protein